MSGESFKREVKNPVTLNLISRFNTASNFLVAFNADKQITYTQDQYRAYMGGAPTLGTVTDAFGKEVAVSWIAIQLDDLANFSGCQVKFNKSQMDCLTEIILTEYGYLKVTELMDFFRRFKTGEYGKFYGSVDPLSITSALQEFKSFRHSLLITYEQRRREIIGRSDLEVVKAKNKLKRISRIKKFYSYFFRSKDFTVEEFIEIWWLFNMGYERSDHDYKDLPP